MNNEEKGQGKARWRINVLDVAILLLVLFSLLVIIHRNNLVEAFERDRVGHSYSVAFEVTSVRYDVVSDLEVGTDFYTLNGRDRVKLGSMLDEPLITLRAGEAITGSTMVDLSGTLLCHGILREGALVLPEGYLLFAGSDLVMNTEVATITVRVISITEIG
ncbi:MAG: hypothetical protein IKC75_07995 [Clostridia bacterium]|nr:hypothetical protein [Clostridia bacterium]